MARFYRKLQKKTAAQRKKERKGCQGRGGSFLLDDVEIC